MAHETGNAAEGGFNTSRRGFLGGTALAATGAIIGCVVPLSPDGGGIPAAHAQTIDGEVDKTIENAVSRVRENSV